jgi:hypothetical protein
MRRPSGSRNVATLTEDAVAGAFPERDDAARAYWTDTRPLWFLHCPCRTLLNPSHCWRGRFSKWPLILGTDGWHLCAACRIIWLESVGGTVRQIGRGCSAESRKYRSKHLAGKGPTFAFAQQNVVKKLNDAMNGRQRPVRHCSRAIAVNWLEMLGKGLDAEAGGSYVPPTFAVGPSATNLPFRPKKREAGCPRRYRDYGLKCR